jgi:hypothetical protein
MTKFTKSVLLSVITAPINAVVGWIVTHALSRSGALDPLAALLGDWLKVIFGTSIDMADVLWIVSAFLSVLLYAGTLFFIWKINSGASGTLSPSRGIATASPAVSAPPSSNTKNNGVRLERPSIFLRPMPATIHQKSGTVVIELEFSLHNAGLRSGIVHNVHIEPGFPVDAPDQPEYSDVGDNWIYEVIPAGGSVTQKQELDVSYWFGYAPECSVGAIIFGFVRYRDSEAREYERGFCFLYRASANGVFSPYGDSRYNYDREVEKQP